MVCIILKSLTRSEWFSIAAPSLLERPLTTTSRPDLIHSLVGVLTRLRQESVAFMADIKAMFYQVFAPEEQRDF